jgi:hypothetical protein
MDLKTVCGGEVEPYLEDIAKLRVSVFKDFPYLYESFVQEEIGFLQPFLKEPRSAFFLAIDQGRVVGASSCMPLANDVDGICSPLLNEKEDIHSIMYFPESVLLKTYRGKGIGVRFFRNREMFSLKKGFRKAVFCAVERPTDHPLKPKNYRSLESFWKNRGYRRKTKVYAKMKWKDVDCCKADFKKMIYWEKILRHG